MIAQGRNNHVIAQQTTITFFRTADMRSCYSKYNRQTTTASVSPQAQAGTTDLLRSGQRQWIFLHGLNPLTTRTTGTGSKSSRWCMSIAGGHGGKSKISTTTKKNWSETASWQAGAKRRCDSSWDCAELEAGDCCIASEEEMIQDGMRFELRLWKKEVLLASADSC